MAELREQYGAFNSALSLLYEDTKTLSLAADDTPYHFNNKVFEDAADMVYEAGGFDLSQMKDERVRKVIQETLNVINTAVNSSIAQDVPDELRFALENNAFVFSGFKTFHAMREVGVSMLSKDGTIKPYEDFKKDVLEINSSYNTNYLDAEYKHALGSSLMASKWADLSQNPERYYLQYRTAGDNKVRDDHQLLEGTTLPSDDPFWSSYYPPNGWGCRCDAVRVRREKYPASDQNLAMMRGKNATEGAKKEIFRYNSGKTMQLFPPKHPYYKAPADAKKVINELAEGDMKEKRIKTLRDQLPNNLTDVEKDAKAANNYEIEQALGIKIGKPMSVEQADKQSANPKHVNRFIIDEKGSYKNHFSGAKLSPNPDYKSSDQQYSINCATCSPAYALRLMGVDVTAKGNVVRSGSINERASKENSFNMWKNADGSKATPINMLEWMSKKGYKQMSDKRYREYFENSCKDEGVYILTIGWKGGSGHATILQRMKDGKLKYIEPQEFDEIQGPERSLDQLCKNGATKPHPTRGILRVDNKIFDTDWLSLFDK